MHGQPRHACRGDGFVVVQANRETSTLLISKPRVYPTFPAYRRYVTDQVYAYHPYISLDTLRQNGAKPICK